MHQYIYIYIYIFIDQVDKPRFNSYLTIHLMKSSHAWSR